MIPKTIRVGFLAAAVAAAACAGMPAQENAPKKRVAVLNFDNPTLPADAPSGLFGADGEDVGKGVSVLLIEKLVKGGKYTVVDRSALETLLKEQKAEDTKDMDAYSLAARIGRMVGLDAMIIGGVTQYGVEDQAKEAKAHGNSFGGAMKTRKAKARVEITAQVFNVTTGQVMSSVVGKGESSQTGNITIFVGRGQAKTSMEMLGSEFANSLLPEAARAAVDQVAEQLDAFTTQIPELRLAIDGRVAEVNGIQLTLNVGKRNGVRVGEQLTVMRDPPAAESTDPQGVALLPQRVGVAAIIEVSDDYSSATLQGSVEAKVGDRVRLVEPSESAPN
jgi:curli biogenesis system outer membrane secretion channel CsgG